MFLSASAHPEAVGGLVLCLRISAAVLSIHWQDNCSAIEKQNKCSQTGSYGSAFASVRVHY